MTGIILSEEQVHQLVCLVDAPMGHLKFVAGEPGATPKELNKEFKGKTKGQLVAEIFKVYCETGSIWVTRVKEAEQAKAEQLAQEEKGLDVIDQKDREQLSKDEQDGWDEEKDEEEESGWTDIDPDWDK